MKKKNKKLEVRKPNQEVRLASNVYIILIISFYSMIGIMTLCSLMLLIGIIAFKTNNLPLFSQIKTVISTIMIIIVLMFLILYPIKNTIEPETKLEKDAFIFALNRLGLKSKCELEKLNGIIHNLKRDRLHFSSESDLYRIYLLLENGQMVDYLISLRDLKQLIKIGQKVKIRNSNLKLPISGWCSDHLSISVIDEEGKTFYKFESYEPFNNKTKLKGRKIVG
ncbi:MAG: hypothetical protein HXM94_00975 [Parvimonas micra]|uniref:Uncharacterized protein n=1 Tax=Parvimonas micra TaxID=33033 RepID=A0A930DZK4_9FIRM|nr:hypothetical protein [Parvimonas micra]MBF1306348.1 hypothetical protein [Parvimonas micra]